MSESKETSRNVCSWCRKMNCGTSKNYIFKTTRGHEVFCSEVCFSTYRRANFRRNKRCDWCRHVRNSINYVDLQDGDNQYQFCSDKCLNQFKLDIFCQETKEHLDIHPYHREQVSNLNEPSASLITPDLWLKNCTSPQDSDKSRSASPVADIFRDTSVTGLPMKIFSTDSQTKLARSFVATNDSSLRKENRMAKFSKKPIRKRKKMQKLRASLPVRDLARNDNCSFVTSVESSTPKISFQPNFSSMLPSEAENCQRSRHFSNHSPDTKPTINKAGPIKNSSGSNLPIPPLLPINKSCEFSSRPSSTSMNPPVRATTSLLRTSNDASLPLPTVLLPYPILLPIVLPIPIPIPVPISATETQTTENGGVDKFDDKNDDDNLDI